MEKAWGGELSPHLRIYFMVYGYVFKVCDGGGDRGDGLHWRRLEGREGQVLLFLWYETGLRRGVLQGLIAREMVDGRWNLGRVPGALFFL